MVPDVLGLLPPEGTFRRCKTENDKSVAKEVFIMKPIERRRNSGIALTVAGIGIMVFAMLTGFTNAPPASASPDASSTIDWVSVVTCTAGFVMVVAGLMAMLRRTPPRTRPQEAN